MVLNDPCAIGSSDGLGLFFVFFCFLFSCLHPKLTGRENERGKQQPELCLPWLIRLINHPGKDIFIATSSQPPTNHNQPHLTSLSLSFSVPYFALPSLSLLALYPWLQRNHSAPGWWRDRTNVESCVSIDWSDDSCQPPHSSAATIGVLRQGISH